MEGLISTGTTLSSFSPKYIWCCGVFGKLWEEVGRGKGFNYLPLTSLSLHYSSLTFKIMEVVISGRWFMCCKFSRRSLRNSFKMIQILSNEYYDFKTILNLKLGIFELASCLVSRYCYPGPGGSC